MQNHIPEAIRLGEKVLNINADPLPFEFAKSVKSYLLDHNQQY
jgi:hypothetical protein